MKITEPIKTIESTNQYIRSAADVFALLQPILLQTPFPHRNREHVWTISLDSANKVLHPGSAPGTSYRTRHHGQCEPRHGSADDLSRTLIRVTCPGL